MHLYILGAYTKPTYTGSTFLLTKVDGFTRLKLMVLLDYMVLFDEIQKATSFYLITIYKIC